MLMKRRAIEALRNGVPNRDAVRVLGCGQPRIEEEFRERLSKLKDVGSTEGLMIQGGFGTGKSHALEYLKHVALEEGFVCSHVVISKETPAFDRAKLYAAAVEQAVMPDQRGPLMEHLLMKAPGRPAYGEFFRRVNQDKQYLPVFGASLWLAEQSKQGGDVPEMLAQFLSGARPVIPQYRAALRTYGGQGTFDLTAPPAAELARQRFAFGSALIKACGYKGWVILLDEVELIARYSLMQRAKSYANLTHLLGLDQASAEQGIATVAAITDDFAAYVFVERGDRHEIRERYAHSERQDLSALVTPAELAMNSLEHRAMSLRPLDMEALERIAEYLRGVYQEAYAQAVGPATVAAKGGRAMRSHIRRWIHEWDLERLYGNRGEAEVDEITMDYTEDDDLTAEPAETP